MPRKRTKGVKYNKVSRQQKYIFLNACMTDRKSISEVLFPLCRLPPWLEYITLLPRPSFSFTKNTISGTTTSSSHLLSKLSFGPLIDPFFWLIYNFRTLRQTLLRSSAGQTRLSLEGKERKRPLPLIDKTFRVFGKNRLLSVSSSSNDH